MDISGLLGDLYESAEKEAVTTEVPAPPAEPPLDDEPVTAPLPVAAELDASHRAAQLRIEDAATVATTTAGSEALLPATLFHEVHHDDLLPRKGVRKSLNISFKR